MAGPSPHARGTLGPRLAVADQGRFIPALAGNTDAEGARTWSAVHPRTRGEHPFVCRKCGTPYGSSPHRGEHASP